ncbi:MAG: hypothetical protein WCI97_11225 [Bacteroidota bacterium]
MKKKFQKLKPVLRIVGYCSIGLVFLIVSVAAINHQQNIPCTDYRIHINTENGIYFLDENDVNQIIKDNNYASRRGTASGEIDYNRLEKIIENNPFAEKSEIVLSPTGDVDVYVQQRLPILRIINKNGVGFYIDKQGKKLPLSDKFTARVTVATGNIVDSGLNEDFSDSTLTNKLFQLASFINSDSLLSALTEQIFITDENEFELVPKIGNHIILLGDINDLQEKTEKLRSFYRDGLNHVGWQQYSLVNLKFKNQVYATRRDVATPQPKTLTQVAVTDSSKLNQTKQKND